MTNDLLRRAYGAAANNITLPAYTMGTWTLLAFVTITWLLWAVGAIQGHCIGKREGRLKPESGVSLAPIIPLFPLVFFGLAKFIDIFVPPWGTWIIGGMHGLFALVFIVVIVWQSLRPTCQ